MFFQVIADDGTINAVECFHVFHTLEQVHGTPCGIFGVVCNDVTDFDVLFQFATDGVFDQRDLLFGQTGEHAIHVFRETSWFSESVGICGSLVHWRKRLRKANVGKKSFGLKLGLGVLGSGGLGSESFNG